jgi:hypothetical protein
MSVDKRINFRGGGAYQGGWGAPGSAEAPSRKTSPGIGGSSGNLGGGGGGQGSESRQYKAPTKPTYTAETIDSKPITGDDYIRSQNNWINAVNTNNQIRANQTGSKFIPYQGGARNTPYYKQSPLSNLLKFAVGSVIPGAGFLLNQGGKFKEGLMSLNNRIQNSDFGRAKSHMDYLDMKKYGGYDERERVRRGENVSDGTYTMSTFNEEFVPSGEIGQTFDEIKTLFADEAETTQLPESFVKANQDNLSRDQMLYKWSNMSDSYKSRFLNAQPIYHGVASLQSDILPESQDLVELAKVTKQDLARYTPRYQKDLIDAQDYQSALETGTINPNMTEFEFNKMKEGLITQPGTYTEEDFA